MAYEAAFIDVTLLVATYKSFDSGLPEPTTVYVHDGILHKSQFYSAVDFVLGKKQRGRGQR